MILNHHYWIFKNELSPHICDEIVRYAEQKNFEKGIVGGSVEEVKKIQDTDDYKHKLKQIRSSNIVWLPEQWVHNEIIPFVNTANRNAGWDFDLVTFETLQFSRYDVGHFYDWHPDQSAKLYEDEKKKNMTRKLSVSVILNDEFSGGDLQFRQQIDTINNPDKDTTIMTCKERGKGTVIVFPSFLWHRVTPVTKGVRNSLVMWTIGKPFV